MFIMYQVAPLGDEQDDSISAINGEDLMKNEEKCLLVVVISKELKQLTKLLVLLS
jgi:hypothetical protein